MRSFIVLLCLVPTLLLAQQSKLETQLKQAIKDKKAEIGIAVIINGKDTVTVNNDIHYPLMSVFKFHQALALADYMGKQKQSLETRLPIKKSDLKPDTYSPLRDKYPQGEIEMSIADLLKYTLQQSDNNACDILFNYQGGPEAVNRYIHSLVFNDDMVTRYKQIRIVNNFLLNIEKTSVLSEDEKEELGAEARFIRAMQYFGLVKRYGGVPLQTVPKEYTAGNTEALYQARDTEAATYDFIINECKAIYESLPEVRSSDAKYRANRGTVLALWSRAALYAGTIVKYSKTLTLTGEAVSKGYVYIPETEAERYFDECYTASSKILDEMVPRVYSLYKSTGTEAEELAQNFYNLFSKAVNGDNGEYIFQKQYNVAAGKGHMWDKLNVPFSYRGDGWGCGMSPVLEMVEEFEYIDGTEGKLKMKDSSGKAISYDSPYDIFKNKDPRLLGSVYLPGADYKGYGGGKIEWIRGVINGQDGIGTKYEASAQPDKENKVVIDGQTYNTSGKDGGSLSVGDASKTGFYQRKFLDESLTDYTNIDAKRSSTPWVVFRLAEIYLNRAE